MRYKLLQNQYDNNSNKKQAKLLKEQVFTAPLLPKQYL